MGDAEALREWCACRLAPLRDGEVLRRVRPDAPGLTRTGRPYLRWANLGTESGWYAIGTREPARSFGDNPDLWQVVLALGTELGNGRLDACHCIGPGVLSVGGLGVTIASGAGLDLLSWCLAVAPERLLEAFGPVTHSSGVYLVPDPQGLGPGCVLRHVEKGVLRERHELSGAVRRGPVGGKWTGRGKAQAGLWVERMSYLLADPRCDEAQCRVAQSIPRLMSAELRERLHWPSNGAEDCWMWTRPQQALWAVAMVVTLDSPDAAETLLLEAVQREPENATTSLYALHEGAFGLRDRRLKNRVAKSIRRVSDIYGVK